MSTTSRNLLLALFLVVALAAITFPLWQPFFVTNVVDEAFPGLTSDQRDALRAMPEDERDTLVEMAGDNPQMAQDTALAMLSGDQTMDEAMPEMAEPVVLARGSFNTFDPVHRGEGTATIYQLADGSRVLRFEDFRTNNGPLLHVRLAKNVPGTIFDPLEDGYIDLGPLKGNVGNQNYDIPADVNLDEFDSVIIYCVPFSVNFTVAAFER